MKKNFAKKIFKFFSILFLFGFAVFPAIGVPLKIEGFYCPECDPIGFLFLFLIIGLLWIWSCAVVNIIFFMEDYRKKDLQKNTLWFVKIYIKYLQSSYRKDNWGAQIAKGAPVLIVAIQCLFILFVFFNGIYNFLAKIF